MAHNQDEIRVCMDIGSVEHYAAVGLSSGERLTEFKVFHSASGIKKFFNRLEKLESDHKLPIVIAMEGYNGYARPIDSYALARGYKVFNVNNHKLARFKEVFPGAAKTDPIDAWKIFELFTLQDTLCLEKNALQEVGVIPQANKMLKRLTRRRTSLVNEKTRICNRIQGDLHAICPGILSITGEVGNRWFLQFLASRNDLTQLANMQLKSLRKIKSVGEKYAEKIRGWQKEAEFSSEVDYAGEMIVSDARRILELLNEIQFLESKIKELMDESEIASRVVTIPGFGIVCSAELAGEIGTLMRFSSESSLALYMGMAVLDNQSGKYAGTKTPRHVNTRLKRAMMKAVFVHVECNPESKKYYEKKRSEGKTHSQAIRSMGRHLVRVIWSMLTRQRDYVIQSQEETGLKANTAEVKEKCQIHSVTERENTATACLGNPSELVADKCGEKIHRVPSRENTATTCLGD